MSRHSAAWPRENPLTTANIEITENQTKPPARFTEGTLLTAMEGAGKLVDDEELREAMSQRGLGTPATRAQIIEGLLLDGYITRQGRDLFVTQKGLSLINLLHGIGIQALTSPEMTGEWEFKLKQMEHGAMPRPEFMEGIRRFAADIVAKAKNFPEIASKGQFTDLRPSVQGAAPPLQRVLQGATMQGCGLVLWKNMAGRELERDEVRSLLETGSVGPLEGFRSKLGRPFSAAIKMDGEFKQAFDFGEDANAANGRRSIFPLFRRSLLVPVCKSGTVHDTGSAYQCSNTPKCKFRMGKTICQREVPREQVMKLIETGKTDLIPRFISKKRQTILGLPQARRQQSRLRIRRRENLPAKKPTGSKTSDRICPCRRHDFAVMPSWGRSSIRIDHGAGFAELPRE